MLATVYPTELALLTSMMAEAFFKARHPRSDEYRNGARDLLLLKLVEKPLKNPFTPGTAQADAWWAGVEEGKTIMKSHLTKGLSA